MTRQDNVEGRSDIDENIVHSPSSSDNFSLGGDCDESGALNQADQLSPTLIRKVDGAYPCMKCDRLFSDRDQLNIHYTHTHREKPQYVCEVCAKVFAVKRELSTHSRIHSGEQPHKCVQCGKEFGTRQLLKKHNMWHSGERSHICEHCGKAFFQVSYTNSESS